MGDEPPMPGDHVRVAVLLGDPRLGDDTKPNTRFTPEDVESVDRLRESLGSLDGYRFRYLDDHGTLLEVLRGLAGEEGWLALNFCDTGYRNDPAMEAHVPAYLEMLGLAYSGCGPEPLALCYDKAATRVLAKAAGVPVPRELVVSGDDPEGTLVPDGGDLPFPALLKPRTGDGSVGIDRNSVAGDREAVVARLRTLRDLLPGRDILVQEFLPGREFAVGLMGNPATGLSVLPVLEVDYRRLDPELPRILSYESKALPESPYWRQLAYREARPGDELRRRLEGWSGRLFDVLGCRDYARFDFRCDADGSPRLLEVNPNPAWCWDGKMNLMAGFEGQDYAGFLRRILTCAQQRVAAARGAW